MRQQRTIRRGTVTGALFIAIGTAYAIGSYRTLAIGTAANMGPGYFPLLLAVLLVVIGATVAFAAQRGYDDRGPAEPIPWRAIALITLAPVVFALTLRGLGLVPATMLAAVIAALADRTSGIVRVTGTAVTLTIITTAIFLYGFKLSADPFGPWIGF